MRLWAKQVSLPVVRRFVARVEEQALGIKVLKGVKPDQQLVKVVNDELVALMGGTAAGLVETGPGKPRVTGQYHEWCLARAHGWSTLRTRA